MMRGGRGIRSLSHIVGLKWLSPPRDEGGLRPEHERNHKTLGEARSKDLGIPKFYLYAGGTSHSPCVVMGVPLDIRKIFPL